MSASRSMRRRGERTRGSVSHKALVLKAQTNVYSAVVRGLVSEIYRELEEGRSLEAFFTRFSRDVTKSLYSTFRRKEEVKYLLEKAREWVDEVYSATCEVFDVAFLLVMKTETRLIVHMRNPYLPLEIGLAWHPYLNLPYIPSSALKGAVRAYLKASGAASQCNLSVEELFGSQDRQGTLIFFDAVPVDFENVLVEPDVITPHYSEAEGRIDEMNVRPRPLVFPTVAAGVTFRTVVAVKAEPNTGKIPTHLLTKLPQWISEALREGFGAKTSVGYGYIRLVRTEKMEREVVGC